MPESYYYADFTFEEDKKAHGPLAHWNARVETMTLLEKQRDLAEPYKTLINIIDDEKFDGALKHEKGISLRD